MMRRLSSIASLIVLLLAIAGAGTADATAQSTVSGTVVSVTGSSLVIRSDAGEEQAFLLDAYTDVPATLSEGDKVTVEFQALADGRKQATRVTVMTGDTGTDVPTMAGTTGTGATDPPAGDSSGTANPLLPVGLAGLVAIGGGVVLRRAFHEEQVGQQE